LVSKSQAIYPPNCCYYNLIVPGSYVLLYNLHVLDVVVYVWVSADHAGIIAQIR
jgi:hypothetical protein